MHSAPRPLPAVMAPLRNRLLHWSIGATFVLALLFAGAIEALANHNHNDLSGDQRCAVCQVVHAAADAPRDASPAPAVLPETRGGLVAAPAPGPLSSQLLVPRLRAPPAA